MFTLRTPFTFVQSRARKLIDGLETQLRTGEVTTRSQLLVSLLSRLGEFTGSLREPSLQPPQVRRDDLLLEEQVTRPVAQADEDLRLAEEQLGHTRELTRQIFNTCQAERSGLSQLLAAVTAQVDQFRLWVSDSDKSFVWASDSFNDLSHLDPASTVHVDPRTGVATLHPVSSRSLSPYLVGAEIDRELSAGGLPGNNLEIRSPGQEAFTGQRPEPRPVRYRDTDETGRLTALWDGAPETFFEWERVYVPVPQPVVHTGRALVYDPSGRPNRTLARVPNWNCYVRWPGAQSLDTGDRQRGYPLAEFEGTHIQVAHGRRQALTRRNPGEREDLRLGLLLTLDQPRGVHWVQLTPLIKSGLYPEVEQILVSESGQRWHPLLSEPTVLHPRMNRGVDFSPQGVTASNYEGVGVWPVPNLPVRYLKIILRQRQAYETRIAHRFFFRALRGGGSRRIWGPVETVGDYASVPGDQVQLQVEAGTAPTRVFEAFDILQAYRQVIAIRDLLLEERVYAAAGELLSVPHLLERPCRATALIVDERVPETWPATRPDGEPWVRYEVSPDGQTWFPIAPQRSTLENSAVAFPEPTQKVWLRASLARPLEREHESPVLAHYALKLLPA